MHNKKITLFWKSVHLPSARKKMNIRDKLVPQMWRRIERIAGDKIITNIFYFYCSQMFPIGNVSSVKCFDTKCFRRFVSI